MSNMFFTKEIICYFKYHCFLVVRWGKLTMTVDDRYKATFTPLEACEPVHE